MPLKPMLHAVGQVGVHCEQGTPKRGPVRAERRQRDTSDQQNGRQHSQGALYDHMNNFSVFRSVYRFATNSA